MRILRLACLSFCLVLCGSNRLSAQEIRAFWADGFSEGFKSPEQVDTLIRRLQTANCNAIFAQMRKGGDAYYLSRYEPWANDNPQHFDALAYLIEKAHACKPRIQVHAWLNTCAVGKTHGNPHHIVVAHPDWKSLSDVGEDYDGEATKIDPGHPDAADWTFRVYLDVLRHYDVDGIHFDFVRYGSTDGKGRFGYNPVSVARFNARYGRSGQPQWEDPLWKQWRRDQVTALVRKVYAMTQTVKPNVAVSAATITWMDGPHDEKGMRARKYWEEKTAGMNRVFQDWRSWMEEGILDMNCQMSYYREPKHADFFRHWIEWGKQNQFRRWVVPSSGIWLNTIPDSLKQIEAIQAPGKKGSRAAGVLLYSYSGTNADADGKEQQSEEFFAALAKPSSYTSAPPFAQTADFPEMPWKLQPKLGHVKGFALTSEGLDPVEGARVSLSGKVRRTQITDGTGFYAFVDIPPGRYRVRVEAPGFTRRDAQVIVEKGRAVSASVFLGSAQSRLSTSVPRSDEPLLDGTPVRLSEAVVAVGTDTSPGVLFIRDTSASNGPVCRVRLLREPPVPIQPGDVVAVIGTLHVREGENVIEAEAVRLVDMLPTGLAPDADALPGIATRMTGHTESIADDRAIVNADGRRVEVFLSGRKLPGVETPLTTIPAPEVGSRLEVEGVTIAFRLADGRTGIRIFPLSPAAVRVVPATFADHLKTAAMWSPAALLGIGIPAWRWRRRRIA